MADKFFEQVTQELAGESTQPAAVKPAQAPVAIPESVVATAASSTQPGTVTCKVRPPVRMWLWLWTARSWATRQQH
jgi:hypothetical protein